MDVVVALDFRFLRTADGRVWTPTAYAHSFWTRYLKVFDRVRIVARAELVARPPEGCRTVDGDNVSFHAVPFYLGPAQYLCKARQVKRAARGAISQRDAVVLRVGGQMAACIVPALWRAGRPYGLEVVGDPYEAFAPGAVRHPLRPFFRWRSARLLRRQCARACGAAYVTESALQSRYPCPRHMAAVSDVELTDDWWAGSRCEPESTGNRSLVFVGSLEQMYKAPDVLLDAFALCVKADPAFHLTVIGEGRHLPELRRRADALGVSARVEFLGSLPAGEAVRRRLDRSSIFVLPSRTEGLPRAMLEAMARGLPCIGTAVGGIPELLPAEDIVPPGDAAGLARKILEVAGDAARMRHMSERNRRKSAQYREEVLRPRRLAFYRHVAAAASEWIRELGAPIASEVTGHARSPRSQNI